MRAYAFVYSRTKNHDYRVLSDLSDSVCPNNIRNCFANRIEGFVINGAGLESPQWLLIKEKGYVLWGVACMNEMLDPVFSKDKFPRALRGFTGYVIPNYSEEPLANDIIVFREIFKKVMAPIFDSYIQKQSKDVWVDVSNTSAFIYPRPFNSSLLNTDHHQCRVFPSSVDAESLVASCLSCPNNISIAINVASIKSVTIPMFDPLTNAVMNNISSDEITDIQVKHICSKCGKEKFDLKEGLCQDCYEKQHPRCRICGQETLDLNDGLCMNCYEKEHPRCERCGKQSDYLQDGLCQECWAETHIYCPKCGKKVERLTAKGICKECEKKNQKRILIYILVLMIVMAFFVVKLCHRDATPSNSNIPVHENIIDHDKYQEKHQSDRRTERALKTDSMQYNFEVFDQNN